MDRRQFLKGVCGVLAAAVLPLPKIVTKVVKIPLNGCLTLMELIKRDRNTNLLDIAEVLSETNEILTDVTWGETEGRKRNLIC